MNIIALVVTYNRKELLEECLDMLLKQTYPLKRIIVFDNNSTDGTDQLFVEGAKYHLDVIHHYKSSSNLGGAGGFSNGMKLSLDMEYDWIWIMDDDTIPSHTCLEELVNSLMTVPEPVSYLASSVFGNNGEPMNVPQIDDSLSENGYSDWYRFLNKGLVRISRATFVSLLINRKAIERVGLPFDKFFIWGDDSEYTLRLSRFYGPGYFVGNSIAIHKRYNTKAISIQNENDFSRIDLYHYFFRNQLIIDHEYGKQFKSVIKDVIVFEKLALKLAISKDKIDRKKAIVINRGIAEFFLGQYDVNGFNNRFEFKDK